MKKGIKTIRREIYVLALELALNETFTKGPYHRGLCYYIETAKWELSYDHNARLPYVYSDITTRSRESRGIGKSSYPEIAKHEPAVGPDSSNYWNFGLGHAPSHADFIKPRIAILEQAIEECTFRTLEEQAEMKQTNK